MLVNHVFLQWFECKTNIPFSENLSNSISHTTNIWKVWFPIGGMCVFYFKRGVGWGGVYLPFFFLDGFRNIFIFLSNPFEENKKEMKNRHLCNAFETITHSNLYKISMEIHFLCNLYVASKLHRSPQASYSLQLLPPTTMYYT